jgi:translation initiation factor 3 subunit E
MFLYVVGQLSVHGRELTALVDPIPPQEKGIYKEEDIMRAKLALLSNTHMVDFAADIHKSLTGRDEVPADMRERRGAVVARLRKLQTDVDPLIKCLENPAVVRSFRQDKQFNVQVS